MAFRSGYVSIIGRPNVGKSTLLNTIIGYKVSIVSSKPQTTRNKITGIKTLPDSQIIFLDTPGIHKPLHKLGEIMVKSALDTVKEVDVVVSMVFPKMPEETDIQVLKEIKQFGKKEILVINKIDQIKKQEILPVIERYAELFSFDDIIPLSALTGSGLDIFLETIKKYLPEGPKLYPDDISTDRIERFLVAELIRERIMSHTREEIPYSVAVEVINWKEDAQRNRIRVDANIYVERNSQKGIIIGSGGALLKKIGTEARKEMEDLFNTKVFLSLWVKVKKDWREDPRFLREIGVN